MTKYSQPRGRRRPTKGDQREAAILATGRQLLDEVALSSITVDQLAQGAGLSRSAFYFYFDSKDAVVYALVTNSLADLGAILDEFVHIEPPQVAIRQAIAKYLQRWIDDGPLLRAMVPSASYFSRLESSWATVGARVNDVLSSLIDTERAAQRAPVGPDSRDIADALMAMMWRAGYEQSIAKPGPATLERAIETLTTVFVRTIWCTPQ